MTKHETFMKMQKFRERRWLSTSVAGGKSCLKSELTPGSRTCREPTERPWIRTFWEQPLPPNFFLLKRAPEGPLYVSRFKDQTGIFPGSVSQSDGRENHTCLDPPALPPGSQCVRRCQTLPGVTARAPENSNRTKPVTTVPDTRHWARCPPGAPACGGSRTQGFLEESEMSSPGTARGGSSG